MSTIHFKKTTTATPEQFVIKPSLNSSSASTQKLICHEQEG